MPKAVENTLILTIDDEQMVRESIKNFLEDYGYEVIDAENGKIGLELLTSRKPDLVLCDLRMPEIDGLEVLARVKEVSPDTPVIVVSGTGVIGDVVQALRRGAFNYILKPIMDMTVLLHAVQNALIQANLKEENIVYQKHLEEQIEARTKELRKTQRYLQNIYDSIPSAMIIIDKDGNIDNINDNASKLINLTHEQTAGKKFWQTSQFLLKLKENYQNVFKSKKELKFSREVIKTGNSYHYKDISIFPLIGQDSEGAVIRIDDVTDLEEKDAQLRQAQKMETVGNLAGGLAHDFNNVLSAITGSVSLLKFDSNIRQNKKLMNHVDMIETAAMRAADMVSQLLTLSRKHEMSFASVDINLSAKHILKICRNTFDKSIETILKPSAGTAMVKADPTQIEQVLLNLCINASHALTIMKNGNEIQGGKIVISIKEKIADHLFCNTNSKAIKNNEYWQLQVKDNGIGMDSKTISKIFDPFFTTKEEGVGTGLGLSMVYNIILQHEGFINVQSEVGSGTYFNIYLPKINEKQKTNSKNDAFKNNINMGSGLILVVDDEEMLREVAKLMLTKCGYEVILAENGAEAIEIFKERQQEIKAILLDMSMPKMSGKEAFIEIKKINKNAKIIMNSGLKQDKRLIEVMNMGADGFIQKPYTFENLANKIKEITS